MKKIILATVLSVAFLSACGGGGSGNNNGNGNGLGSPFGGTNAANANAACSDGFVRDAISYNNALQAVKENASDANAQALKDSCDKFRAHNARTVACTYTDQQSGKKYNLAAAGVYDTCGKVDDAINHAGGGNNQLVFDGKDSCSDEFLSDYNALNSAVASRDSKAIVNKCEAFKARNTQLDVCDTVVNKNGAEVQIHVDGSDVYAFCARQN